MQGAPWIMANARCRTLDIEQDTHNEGNTAIK